MVHVAPLGLWLLDMPPFYKYVVPLGLNAEPNQNSRRHAIVGAVSSNTGGEPNPYGFNSAFLWIIASWRPVFSAYRLIT